MSASSIDFWRCDSLLCRGRFTPMGSRAAGKCLTCSTPMPEHAKQGHAVNPDTDGPARGKLS